MSKDKSCRESDVFHYTALREAMRLLGVESSDIERNRLAVVVVCEISLRRRKRTRLHRVLWCRSLVCDYGGPAMASAGMGDVLAGAVAGMLASNGLSRSMVIFGQKRFWPTRYAA